MSARTDGIRGAQSNITLVPSEKLAVVCLINASTSANIADEIVDQIIDQLAPDLEKQLTYEKYAAVYETPYRPTPKLLGVWQGSLETGKEKLPVRLFFAEDGKVTIQVGDQETKELEQVVFNQFERLESGFLSRIPVPEYPETDEAYTNLVLQLYEGRLIGHVAPMFSNEKGSFCYGAFVCLEKTGE